MRRCARSGAVLTVTSLKGPFLVVIFLSVNVLVLKCGEASVVECESEINRPSCSVFPEQKVERYPR